MNGSASRGGLKRGGAGAPLRFRQGSFDGLCGVYSIINSFALLLHGQELPRALAVEGGDKTRQFDNAAAQELFNHLCVGKLSPLDKRLKRKGTAAVATRHDLRRRVRVEMFEGTSLSDLQRRLLPKARKFGKKVGIRLVAKRPFRNTDRRFKGWKEGSAAENRKRLGVVWGSIYAHLQQPGAVALLGVSGRHNHWTVVKRATTRKLELWDSGHLRHVKRCDATYGVDVDGAEFSIQASDVILLKAKARARKRK